MGILELVIESDAISIFSPKYDGETMTEFEKFMKDYGSLQDPLLKKDFDAIITLLNKMLNDCGARENLFRPEGKNKVYAIPLLVERKKDKTVGSLRLYCIRISQKLLIIGNGGVKKVRSFQKDPILYGFVKQLRSIEKNIYRETCNANTGFDDFDTVKKIIENLII